MNTENEKPTPAADVPAAAPVPAADPPANDPSGVNPPAEAPKEDADDSKPAQDPLDKPVDANAVPRPQLGMPIFRRRAEPIQYDSQSEIPGRCEDWLLIPVKKYPLINWRFLLGGNGSTLSPLTLIERETGAAILVRNMKRTMNRRPIGAGGFMGTAGFAEVQRFQEALAALQKAEREAAIMAVAEGAGGGGTANAIRGGDSNAAIPPTPKNEGVEGVKNRQLPGDGAALTASPPNINIKLADAAVTTPAPSSPIQEEVKLGSGSEPQGKPIGNLPALKEEEETKDKGEKTEADTPAEVPKKDGDKKDDDKMDVDNDDTTANPIDEEPIDPRKAPENKDIGLHCWIVGTLQSEVDHAYAKIEVLLAYAIKEYEAWLEEHGDESSDEEADEVEGKDVVMEGADGPSGEGEVKKPVEVKL